MNRLCDWVYNVRKQLKNFGFAQSTPSEMYCDSSTARKWAMNPSTEHKTRAIRTKEHRVRGYIKKKKIKIIGVKGTDNPADIFTKILKSKEAFWAFRKVIMNHE